MEARLELRLSVQEKERWEREASDCGLSLSQWIRDTLNWVIEDEVLTKGAQPVAEGLQEFVQTNVVTPAVQTVLSTPEQEAWRCGNCGRPDRKSFGSPTLCRDCAAHS